MKLLVLVGLLGLTVAAPPPAPMYYHDTVGIPTFNQMKAAESATDFDGSRIVGGSAASVGQFPHVGGMIIDLIGNRQSVCGCSLISHTRCLTAAHCWFDGSNQAIQITVVLGTVFLFSGGTRIVSSSVVMHEQWNPSTIQNDVALVHLSHVPWTNAISNINLPSSNLLDNNFVGFNAVAAGYGVQRDWTGISNNQQMHHVTVPVLANADCARWFGTAVVASTICIDGAGGRSTCGGDSGGPLQINSGGPVLIGVTSFGFRFGCQLGWPAAFARVTSFNTWIRARM